VSWRIGCKAKRSNPGDGGEKLQEEALLQQTDRATRCVGRNLVSSWTVVGISCTTNLEQIEVTELDGSDV